MIRRYDIGDRVALDLPGDPNDGMQGVVIDFLAPPWYRVRWENPTTGTGGHVVNSPEVFLKDGDVPMA